MCLINELGSTPFLPLTSISLDEFQFSAYNKDTSCTKVTHKNYLNSWYAIFIHFSIFGYVNLHNNIFRVVILAWSCDKFRFVLSCEIQAPWLTTVSQTEWLYCKYKIFDQLMGLVSVKCYSECVMKQNYLKDSSYPSHFMFEINVGKCRIRHRTTLNLNDFNRFWIDLVFNHSLSESLYVGSGFFRHWFQTWNGFSLDYP